MSTSLGELAGRVRVRRLTQDETFLLAALHLQGLRERGTHAAEHVQRMGQAWHARVGDHPAWVAEHDDQHVGMTICRLPLLPHVGSGLPELVVLEALGEPEPEAVALALVREVVAWARTDGYAAVEVAPEVRIAAAVLDAARADVRPVRRVSLPTRP